MDQKELRDRGEWFKNCKLNPDRGLYVVPWGVGVAAFLLFYVVYTYISF